MQLMDRHDLTAREAGELVGVSVNKLNAWRGKLKNDEAARKVICCSSIEPETFLRGRCDVPLF